MGVARCVVPPFVAGTTHCRRSLASPSDKTAPGGLPERVSGFVSRRIFIRGRPGEDLFGRRSEWLSGGGDPAHFKNQRFEPLVELGMRCGVLFSSFCGLVDF